MLPSEATYSYFKSSQNPLTPLRFGAVSPLLRGYVSSLFSLLLTEKINCILGLKTVFASRYWLILVCGNKVRIARRIGIGLMLRTLAPWIWRRNWVKNMFSTGVLVSGKRSSGPSDGSRFLVKKTVSVAKNRGLDTETTVSAKELGLGSPVTGHG